MQRYSRSQKSSLSRHAWTDQSPQRCRKAQRFARSVKLPKRWNSKAHQRRVERMQWTKLCKRANSLVPELSDAAGVYKTMLLTIASMASSAKWSFPPWLDTCSLLIFQTVTRNGTAVHLWTFTQLQLSSLCLRCAACTLS